MGNRVYSSPKGYDSTMTAKGITVGALAHLTKQQKQQIEAEAKPLLQAGEKCRLLWAALNKADFRNEGRLNEANIVLVFEQNKKIIEDLLKITKAADFIEAFDHDKDNYLNEDEQILIFSVIKTKIQIMAETLCDIHNYSMYKSLMKEVRDIEGQIVDYQDKFRQKIYMKQLQDYSAQGGQIIKEEKNHWKQMLFDYRQQLLKKVEQLQQSKLEEEEMLKRALEHPRETTRIKSIPKVRDLQYQEKLVAINERVEEAMNYRKELKILEEENERKKKLIKEKQDEKTIKRFAEITKKELKELDEKIQANQNLLKRTQDIQIEVINKKVMLHVTDIKRMQGLLGKYAKQRGKIEDEARRVRDNARKTMKVMSDFKKISSNYSATGRKSPLRNSAIDQLTMLQTSNPFLFSTKKMTLSSQSSVNHSGMNSAHYRSVLEPLHQLGKAASFSKFDICSTVLDKGEKPINKQDETLQGSIEKRIKSLLSQRKQISQDVPSVASQFDDDLNPIE